MEEAGKGLLHKGFVRTGRIAAGRRKQFFFVEGHQIRYENNLVVQGDMLLEVLDKNCRKLRLPVFIRKIAPKAMEGLKEIILEALFPDQVKCWSPLLRAQRAVLQIHKGAWLPLSHIGGFEPALPEEGFIDFQAYDKRFSRIQDRELKLEMAISRFLYPVELEEKARVSYEEFLKNRFRPASLQLVSGKWNRYGTIPDRAGELLALKKIDRFLKKELLETAAFYGQPEFAALIMKSTENGMGAVETCVSRAEGMEKEATGDAMITLWKAAVRELYRRKPEMELFCGMLKFYPVEKSEIKAFFVEKHPENKKMWKSLSLGWEQMDLEFITETI